MQMACKLSGEISRDMRKRDLRLIVVGFKIMVMNRLNCSPFILFPEKILHRCIYLDDRQYGNSYCTCQILENAERAGFRSGRWHKEMLADYYAS